METLKVPVTLPTLMNSSQMAEVCIINRKIKYANKKFIDLIGYSSDELLEMSENKITRLVDPRYRAKFSNILDTMKCPQSFLKDMMILKKNNKVDDNLLVDMYFRCLLHREDKEVLMISLCDKTEEFHRFNESPNLIFDWRIFREHIDVSVVNLIRELVKDVEKNIDRLIPHFDGTIENSNKLAMDIFHFPGNVTGELTIFNAVDDDDDYRLKIINSVSEILADKTSTSIFRIIDKTNKVFDLEVQSKLIFNNYPYIVRSIGRDISETKRSYTELIEDKESKLKKEQDKAAEIQKLSSLSESTIAEVRKELQSLVGLVEQFGLLIFVSMETKDSVLMLQNRTRNRIEKIGLILKDYYERTSGNIDEDKFIPLGNKELILLASSDAEFIDHMKPYLIEKNYTPLIAMNNESMFKSLDELKPDMLILNFDSPLDLLQKVNKNGKRKVIVLTSNPKIQTSQYIEAGAIDTIRKPVFGPELLKTIYYSLLQ